MNSQWISSEHIPQLHHDELKFHHPTSSIVLFHTEDKTVHLGYVVQTEWCKPYADEAHLYRWYDENDCQIENVDYWMPIPKTP